MKYRLTGLGALACLALLLALPGGRAEEKEKGKTIELFNGKNLDGWKIYLDPKAKVKAKPEEVFKVTEGVIDCTGRPNGYILTEKEYGDYVLEVEWRWPARAGNSGVFVHVSGPDKIWPKGAEAQLYAGHAGDFWLVDGFKLTVDEARQDKKTPRHFYRMKTDKPVEKKVGEWNKYVITCKLNTISLRINGQVVNVGTHAEASKGKILLQSEGAPVQFRNIKLAHVR